MMFSPQPKPEPRQRAKGRKHRQEAQVVKTVRVQVAERDGYCRVLALLFMFDPSLRSSLRLYFGPCSGQSEWAHYGDQKRAKTRGKAPVERRTRAGSFMLCAAHHRGTKGYDAGELLVTARDRIEPLINMGKTEAEVANARPLADLDAKWADDEQAARNYTRMVYNSFKRS